MNREEIFKEISIKNDKKILLVVMDGLGDIPYYHGKTVLEIAHKPNLDALAGISELGSVIPVLPGVTPGSGPGHLSLFGYEPTKYEIGRGVLEALGLGIDLEPLDIAIRGNFCTVKEENGKLIVVDRRAGRIPTEENVELCKLLSSKIKCIEDVEVSFTPGMEHRFVIVLRGENLGGIVEDTDPQKEGLPPKDPIPVTEDAKKLTEILKKLTAEIREVLKSRKYANFVLLRGISRIPNIPSMEELFKLNPCAIAVYPMYKGLAKLVGMKVIDVNGETISHEVEKLKEVWNEFDFFYLHIKKTDSYGEDGNLSGKVKVIEEFDRVLPEILKLKPDVLVITCDHSTPAILKGHSWHPCPVLFYSPYVFPSGADSFTEKNCLRGTLKVTYSYELMGLMLAHSGKLIKFGA
ncbi:MAG: 2,3-bisphosphoglycerate-independent phosphoglycerate mutase [Thermosulfidibacteraceae bacterium]